MGIIGFVFAYVGGAIAISVAWPRRAKSVLLLGALICIGFALAPRDFGDFHFNWESAFAVSLIFALFGNMYWLVAPIGRSLFGVKLGSLMLTVATASFVILFPGSPQEKLLDAAREYQRRNAATQEESKENTLDAPEPLDQQLPTHQQQMLDIEAFVISFTEPAPKKEDLDKDNIWPPR